MCRVISPWEGVLILRQLCLQPFRKQFPRQAMATQVNLLQVCLPPENDRVFLLIKILQYFRLKTAPPRSFTIPPWNHVVICPLQQQEVDLQVKHGFHLQSRTKVTGQCGQHTVKHERQQLHHKSKFKGVSGRGHSYEERPDTSSLSDFVISQFVLIYVFEGKQTRFWGCTIWVGRLS